ncbi:MAG: hypothetical protein H7838_08480 [Magnetococcus sp. DMHC-8]
MDHPSSTGWSAADAIQAALTAEQAAMQAVADCRAQAEQILDEARRQVSELAARTDAQISDLHKEYNKRIRKLEEATQPPPHRLPTPADHAPDAVLQAAVGRMAAWLTSEVDTPPAPPGPLS